MSKTSVFKDERIVGSPAVHFTILAVLLFATWLILSGHYYAKYIIMGFGTAIISAYLSMPLFYVQNPARTKKFFVLGVNLVSYVFYWAWLINEVRCASMDVTQATMKSEMDIEPKFIAFRMPYENPMAHATLANSITLTPGTVTMNVTDDGVYTVHALTTGAAEGLLDGGMQMKIAELFGETCEVEIIHNDPAVREVLAP